jgi:hypothetical protein
MDDCGVVMSVIDFAPRIDILVDFRTHVETAVIGLFAEDEFGRAQIAIPDLRAHAEYEDWLDCREGFQMGLAMAGVDAKLVCVPLAQFLAWRRRAAAPLGERSLDAFAAMLWRQQDASKAATFACVPRCDFESHIDGIADFGPHGRAEN